MFNRDFYPTPDEVISRMLNSEDLFDKIIYEPHGGKGNIVDYVNEFYPKRVYATEIVPELRSILSDKCTLLPQYDFLKVISEDIPQMDYIIMNPPFSTEEEHILHAWRVAPKGCRIITLCSSPTVQNPDTAKRKEIAQLIQNYGKQSYFGRVFEDSERKTSVEVSCIWLRKPESDFDLSSYFNLEDDEYVDCTKEGLMPYNNIYDLVSRYTSALMKFDSVMEVNNEMYRIISPINGSSDICFGALKVHNDRGYTTVSKVTREEFAIELQKSAWREVVVRTNVRKFVTSTVLDELDSNIEKQLTVKFTMKNIYNFLEMVIGTKEERFNKVIVEQFMKICSHSKDNHTGGEGWRTNSDYMINRRFIIPSVCNFETYYHDERVRMHVGQYRMFDDLEKAMCYLTGVDYDSLTVGEGYHKCHNSLSNYLDRQKPEWGKWFEWNQFFSCRGYKKGTMHFEFRDEDVWRLFNITVCKAMGWKNTLPKQQERKKRK